MTLILAREKEKMLQL